MIKPSAYYYYVEPRDGYDLIQIDDREGWEWIYVLRRNSVRCDLDMRDYFQAVNTAKSKMPDLRQTDAGFIVDSGNAEKFINILRECGLNMETNSQFDETAKGYIAYIEKKAAKKAAKKANPGRKIIVYYILHKACTELGGTHDGIILTSKKYYDEENCLDDGSSKDYAEICTRLDLIPDIHEASESIFYTEAGKGEQVIEEMRKLNLDMQTNEDFTKDFDDDDEWWTDYLE